MTITATDQGGSGLAFNKPFVITVIDVVDSAGVANSAPAAASTPESTPLVFSVANGNAISIDDGSASASVLRTTLSVTNGTLSLASTAGLTSVSGEGTTSVTVTGAENAINNALDGLAFTPTTLFNGSVNLQVTTDVKADIVGFYEFENPANPADDTSPVGSNDGSVTGSPTTTFDATRNSDVAVLDGVNDHLRFTGNRFGTPANITVAAWVNANAVGNQEVISLGNSVVLRLNDSNQGAGVTGLYYNGSNWDHTNTSTVVAGDGWHHVAYTFDDTSRVQTLYIDGVVVGMTSFSNAISWTLSSNSTIGMHVNGSSYEFDGRLDDARIYDRALSASEIQAIANDGSIDTDVIAVSVTPVNNPPTDISLDSLSVSENVDGAVVGNLTTTDPDAGDSHTYTIDDARFEVAGAQLKLKAGQSLDFETDPTVPLTVTTTDAASTSFNKAFTISVNDVNESPSISNATFSVDEDAASGTSVGFAAGSDPDAVDTLTRSILGGNTNGAFSLNASTGELTVANPSTLDFETIPSYTLNVQIQDAGGLTDTATVVVNISDINETPTTTGLANVTVNEDATNVPIDLTTAFADVETPSALLAYSVTGNSNPTLFASTSISGRVLTLDFAPNLSGAATITVQARDPQGLTVSSTFNVTVRAVNDAPVASADSYAVEAQTLSVSATAGVLANDTDVEADTLTALLISGPANGALTLQSDGSFVYEPEMGFNGTDSFSYQTFDGAATSATRTVTLNVSGKAVTPPPVSPEASTDSSSDSSESESDAEVNDEKAELIDASPTTEGVHNQIDPDDGPSEATVAEDNDSDDESDAVISSDFGLTKTNQDFFAMSSERLELKDATNVRSSVNSLDRSVAVSSEKELRLQDSLRFDGEDLSYLVGTDSIKELEQIEEDFEFNGTVPEWAAGTAVATTASISVGYIMWMLRGGYVLASVLSTMPVWQNIDPLPVLAALDNVDDGDDDSLETMIDRASEEADDSETQVAKEATDELRKEGTV